MSTNIDIMKEIFHLTYSPPDKEEKCNILMVCNADLSNNSEDSKLIPSESTKSSGSGGFKPDSDILNKFFKLMIVIALCVKTGTILPFLLHFLDVPKVKRFFQKSKLFWKE